MTRETSEKGRNAEITENGGQINGQSLPLILCGCGQHSFSPHRKDQRFASRLCKDRTRNHQRYERQKQATALAIQILENQGYEVKKK